MQYGNVVKVKFLGPTNFRGARWSAQVTDGGMNAKPQKHVIISHDPGTAPYESAHKAAQAAMAACFTQTEPFEASAYGDLSPAEYVFIF